MELDRFLTILQAYGASSERWPEPERGEALALLARSLPAVRAQERARQVDLVFEASGFAHTSLDPHRFALLRARIVVAANPLTQSWMGRWFGIKLTPMQIWPPVAGLAMATLLGFAVGLGGILQAEPNRDVDDGLTLSSNDLTIGSQ